MKTESIKRVFIVGICFLVLATLSANAQELKDYDGNVYKIVNRGNQAWISKNLSVSHFRNGDPISETKTPQEWKMAASSSTPAWCYYENNPENENNHGKLYNWFAINDPRGLAPEGWHVSGNSDWRTLIKNLTGIDIAGIKLKDKEGWKTKNGTNQIGFSAFPSGYREADGKFRDLGKTCQWWSNSVPVEIKSSDKIYSIILSDYTAEVKFSQSEKGAGFSVRCEKN